MSIRWICARGGRTPVFAVLVMAGSVTGVAAQTTLMLNTPVSQVGDTTVQGGAKATTNFSKSDVLGTSANANPDEVRHALLKFDTQNTMPGGSTIVSATLTLTLKSAGADSTRTVSVFPVTRSFAHEETTWTVRRAGYAWGTGGGDFGMRTTSQTVSNVAGSKVAMNVTALVQAAVSGATASRYTRIGLVDTGAPSTGSLRQFYSSKAADPSTRPVLTVVYGGDAGHPTTAAAWLRVLQYNTHHGGWGTDGVYNPARVVAWIARVNPDLVSLNEIEVGTSWSRGADQTVLYHTLLQSATGRPWYKAFIMNSAGATAGRGNLILSRYPFIATAGHSLPANRAAVDVTVSVNGRTINVSSTHLDNVSANRLAEVADLLAWESTFAEQRLVLGDYRARPDSPAIAAMKAFYSDTWQAAQALGTAAGDGTTQGANRVDYIFQSKTATLLKLLSVQIFDTSDANGVRPSDHEPVLAVFEVR